MKANVSIPHSVAQAAERLALESYLLSQTNSTMLSYSHSVKA